LQAQKSSNASFYTPFLRFWKVGRSAGNVGS